MQSDLERFLSESIKNAARNKQDACDAENFLGEFTGALSTTLSTYFKSEISVLISNGIDDIFSRMNQFSKQFNCLKGAPKVQREIEGHTISVGLKGGTISELASYTPDPVKYFPTVVSYGSKEISCDNAAQVRSAMKTMADDSMGQIVECIERQLKKRESGK